MASETEVSNIIQRGSLVFSSDNEIITVKVAASQTLIPGDGVILKLGVASKATASNRNILTGFGVVIHEGVTTGTGTNTSVVQIATGNAYVVCEAAGIIQPIHMVQFTDDGEVAQSTLSATADISTIRTFVHEGVIGRSYGNPGEMVNPSAVAANGLVVVRLGQ